LVAHGIASEFLYDTFTVTSDTLPAGTPVPEWGGSGNTGLILRWNLVGTFSPRTPGINLGTTQFSILFIQPSFAPLIEPVTVVSSQGEQFDLSDSADIGREFRFQFFRDLRVGDSFMVEVRMYVHALGGICSGGTPCSMSASFSASTNATSKNPDVQLSRAGGRPELLQSTRA
jgi:hypothetical protein